MNTWVSKTCKNPFVEISNTIFRRRLKQINSTRTAKESLFEICYHQLDLAFTHAVQSFGLEKLVFDIHYLRPGGSTHALLHRFPISKRIYCTRWASEYTCRRYSKAALALLVGFELSPMVEDSLLQLAKCWKPRRSGETSSPSPPRIKFWAADCVLMWSSN